MPSYHCCLSEGRVNFTLPRLLNNVLGHDHTQWHPSAVRYCTNSWHCYWTRPIYRIWPFYRIPKELHGNLRRVWHAERGRLLIRTPDLVPFWDLHMFCCWICHVFSTLNFERPYVLLLYFDQNSLNRLISMQQFHICQFWLWPPKLIGSSFQVW